MPCKLSEQICYRNDEDLKPNLEITSLLRKKDEVDDSMSLLPSSPRSTSLTSPSSTSFTPHAVSLAPTDLQIAHPTYSDEEELQDYRGPYPSDSVQFTNHPTVRVTSTHQQNVTFPFYSF